MQHFQVLAYRTWLNVSSLFAPIQSHVTDSVNGKCVFFRAHTQIYCVMTVNQWPPIDIYLSLGSLLTYTFDRIATTSFINLTYECLLDLPFIFFRVCAIYFRNMTLKIINKNTIFVYHESIQPKIPWNWWLYNAIAAFAHRMMIVWHSLSILIFPLSPLCFMTWVYRIIDMHALNKSNNHHPHTHTHPNRDHTSNNACDVFAFCVMILLNRDKTRTHYYLILFTKSNATREQNAAAHKS